MLNRLDQLSRGAEKKGQYSAAARCEELIGKEIGMFVDRSNLKLDFPTDLAQCSEDQLIAAENLILALEYGNDQARIRQERRRLQLRAGLEVGTTAEGKEVAQAEVPQLPEPTAEGSALPHHTTPLPDSIQKVLGGVSGQSWLNLDAAERTRLREIWTARGPVLPEGFKDWAAGPKVEWLDRNWPIEIEKEG